MTSVAGAAALRPHTATRSIAALFEEQLIIPSYSSSWAFAAIAVHRASALPLQLNGTAERRAIASAGETIRVLTVGRRKLLDPFLTELFDPLPASTGEGRRRNWSPTHLREVCSIAHGDTVWFPLMGLRQGNPELFQRGASVAAIALPIEWARDNGFRRVELGRTGSFVNDGLQQYKRKWGFYPVPDPLSLVVAVRAQSLAARQAFARQPVLAETEEGLETYTGEIA